MTDISSAIRHRTLESSRPVVGRLADLIKVGWIKSTAGQNNRARTKRRMVSRPKNWEMEEREERRETRRRQGAREINGEEEEQRGE